MDLSQSNVSLETLRHRIRCIWAMQWWQKHLFKRASRRNRRLNWVNFWMAADTGKLSTSLHLSLSSLSFDTLRCRIYSMWVMKGWQKHIIISGSRSNRRLNGANFWMAADTAKLIISSDLLGKTLGVSTFWCPNNDFYMIQGYEMDITSLETVHLFGRCKRQKSDETLKESLFLGI